MRRVNPDKKKAESILEAADREMGYVLAQKMAPDAAATLVRGMYECFRAVGDALLVARGMEAKDHHPMIDEVLHLEVKTPQPIVVLDRLRRTRMNINYEGYFPSPAELQEFAQFSRDCWKTILAAARKKLGV